MPESPSPRPTSGRHDLRAFRRLATQFDEASEDGRTLRSQLALVDQFESLGFGMLEFLVDSISDAGHILGRNGDRDISVGTTFTAIQRSRVVREAAEFRSENLGEAARVSLTLREVHCYRRSLDAIPGGYTAALAVTGEGLQLLANMLDELPSDEYLWLVKPNVDAEPSG